MFTIDAFWIVFSLGALNAIVSIIGFTAITEKVSGTMLIRAPLPYTV